MYLYSVFDVRGKVTLALDISDLIEAVVCTPVPQNSQLSKYMFCYKRLTRLILI